MRPVQCVSKRTRGACAAGKHGGVPAARAPTGALGLLCSHPWRPMSSGVGAIAVPRAHGLPGGDEPQDQVGEVQAPTGSIERQRARSDRCARPCSRCSRSPASRRSRSRRVGSPSSPKRSTPRETWIWRSLGAIVAAAVPRARWRSGSTPHGNWSVREHVPRVHSQDGLVPPTINQGQRANRTERLVLAVVVDRDAVASRRRKRRLDKLREVSFGGDRRCPFEAVRLCAWRTTMWSIAIRHQRSCMGAGGGPHRLRRITRVSWPRRGRPDAAPVICGTRTLGEIVVLRPRGSAQLPAGPVVRSPLAERIRTNNLAAWRGPCASRNDSVSRSAGCHRSKNTSTFSPASVVSEEHIEGQLQDRLRVLARRDGHRQPLNSRK